MPVPVPAESRAEGKQGRHRSAAESAARAQGRCPGRETTQRGNPVGQGLGWLLGPNSSGPRPPPLRGSGGAGWRCPSVQTQRNHRRTRTQEGRSFRRRTAGFGGETRAPSPPPHARPPTKASLRGTPGRSAAQNVTSVGGSPAPSPSDPVSAAVAVGRGRGAGRTARGRCRDPRPSGPGRPRAPCTWRAIFARAFPPRSRTTDRWSGRGSGDPRAPAPPRPPREPRLPAPARGGGALPGRRRKEGARVSGPENTARGRARAAHLAAGARAGGGSGPAQLCPESRPPRLGGGPPPPRPRPTAPPGRPSPGVARGPRGRGRLLAGTRSPPARAHSRAPPGPPPPPRAPAPTSRRTTSPPRRPPPARPPARLPSI